ncbi:MAG: CCA tRNA nucleotidyltransferase [Chloroflexi bacterium]|nr:CCA tRNA nucleotidyltransferase [Chloroflexota bacterium]
MQPTGQPTRQPTFAASLASEQHEVFDAVRAFAQREGVNAYLVGGAVRDWLMGLPIGDLDFVVEADAIAFTQALQRHYSGALQAYDKFRTATWLSHGLHNDIATARSETYAHPAVLPSVTPAGITQDLLRRDFTINAIALRLYDETLLDPLGGQADLHNRLLRALHARSFIDDPTRMLRAARYAARFGFTLDAQTRQWLEAGLPYVKDLSGERVKYDIELILDIPRPEDALSLLNEWGMFQSIGIVVPAREQLQQRYARAREQIQSGAWDMASLRLPAQQIIRAIGWGALIYNLGQMSASRWVDLIPFPAEVRDALVSRGVLSTLSPALFGGRPSAHSALLGVFSGLALLIGWLFDADDRKRRAMYDEWHTWRAVQPVTSGDDLRNRGLPPGPRYRQLLARLRDAWLDGEVHSPDEEHALLDRLLQQEQ